MSNIEVSKKTNPTKKTALPKVLLVDDDARLMRALERSFEDEFDILTAVSPAEAHAILEQEEVDLVLSDNLMSGSLGTEFLHQVRAKYPRMRLLMLSGFLPPAAAKRVVREGDAIEVLIKPCAATDVAAAIRSALASPDHEEESDSSVENSNTEEESLASTEL